MTEPVDAPDVVIGTIPKNQRERLRVAVREFKGHRFADLRIHFVAEDGSLKATAKGITVRRDQIAELLELLVKAEAELGRAGAR